MPFMSMGHVVLWGGDTLAQSEEMIVLLYRLLASGQSVL